MKKKQLREYLYRNCFYSCESVSFHLEQCFSPGIILCPRPWLQKHAVRLFFLLPFWALPRNNNNNKKFSKRKFNGRNCVFFFTKNKGPKKYDFLIFLKCARIIRFSSFNFAYLFCSSLGSIFFLLSITVTVTSCKQNRAVCFRLSVGSWPYEKKEQPDGSGGARPIRTKSICFSFSDNSQIRCWAPFVRDCHPTYRTRTNGKQQLNMQNCHKSRNRL